MIQKLAVVLFVSVLTCVASAKEGFSFDVTQLPQSLQRAWDSVYFINAVGKTTGRTGTAFLVATLPSINGTDLYFVTAAHLAADAESLQLIPNVRFTQSVEGLSFTMQEGLNLTSVDVAFANETPDLALLHARLPKSAPVLRPLQMRAECRLKPGEKLFAMGFSNTALRTATDRIPIIASEASTKRWSEGLFINYKVLPIEEVRHTVSLTTVDILHGGSGGPLLDTEGRVAGVLQLNATGERVMYKYVGTETPADDRAPHSAAVPCELVSAFIEAGIRMHQLQAKNAGV